VEVGAGLDVAGIREVRPTASAGWLSRSNVNPYMRPVARFAAHHDDRSHPHGGLLVGSDDDCARHGSKRSATASTALARTSVTIL
jgi:hypothetical protein